MFWTDLTSTEPSREWLGLELKTSRKTAGHVPRTRVELEEERRLRLLVAGRPVFWSRVWHDFYGYGYASVPAPEVLPPLTQALVRETTRVERGAQPRAWARLFADLLTRSEDSPLDQHDWLLVPANGRGLGVEFGRRQIELLASSIDLPRIGEAPWDIGDEMPPVALRPFPGTDDGRVKSWRKNARAGTLPPALLWWVAGLDRLVLLDGHSRIVAAQAEGVAPTALILSAMRKVKVPESEATAATVVEKLVARDPQVHGWKIDELNRLLITLSRPYDRQLVTRAWPPSAGAAWAAELAAVVPATEDERATLQFVRTGDS